MARPGDALGYYYEEGYIEAGYYEYEPYIEEGYIDATYFQEEGAILQASAALTLSSTVLATVGVIKQGVCALSGVFTPSIFAVASRNGSIDMAAQIVFAASANANRSADVTLENLVNLSLQAARIRDNAMALAAAFAATSTANRTRDYSSSLAVSTEQSTTGTRIKQLSASLEGVFTPGIVAVVSRNGSIDIAVIATLNVDSSNLEKASAELSTAATLTAQATTILQAESDLNGVFEQTASSGAIRRTAIAIQSLFTQNASINLIAGTSTSLTVNGTINSEITRIKQLSAQLDAFYSALTVAAKVGDFFVDADVQATVSCTASKFVGTLNNQLFTTATVDCDASLIKSLSADLVAMDARFGAVATRIKQLDALIEGVFLPTISAVVSRNGSVDIAANTNIQIVSSRIKGLASDIAVTTTAAAAAGIIKVSASDIAVTTTAAATAGIIKELVTTRVEGTSTAAATARTIKGLAANLAVNSLLGTLQDNGSIGTDTEVIVNPGANLIATTNLNSLLGEIQDAQAQLTVVAEIGTVDQNGNIGIGTNVIVIVNPGSSFSASTGLTSTANIIANKTASLSLTATVVCNPTKISGSTELIGEFTLTAIPDFRPFDILSEGDITFDTAIKKWGPASINVGILANDRFYVEGLNDAFNTQYYRARDNEEGSNDGFYTSFDIGFWLYIPNGLTSSEKNLITITNQYGVDNSLVINEDYLRINYSSQNSDLWDETVDQPAGNTWHHIRWNRKLNLGSFIGSGNFFTQLFDFKDTLYVNGVQHTVNFPGTYTGTISTISFGNGSGYKFDDIHAHKFLTVEYPSEPYRNTDDTAFLIHGDGSLVDDTGEIESAVINMFSVAALNASATNIKGVAATLLSQFGIGILNTRIISGDATLVSTSTLACDATVFELIDIDPLTLASTSTLACDATLFELIDIDPATFSSVFTVSSNPTQIKQLSSDITTQSTVECNASVTLSASADIGAQTTVFARPVLPPIQLISLVAATSTLTVDASANYQSGATANANFNLDLVFFDTERYSYVVPKETRVFAVEAETRKHTIHKETRIYTLGEL